MRRPWGVFLLGLGIAYLLLVVLLWARPQLLFHPAPSVVFLAFYVVWAALWIRKFELPRLRKQRLVVPLATGLLQIVGMMILMLGLIPSPWVPSRLPLLAVGAGTAFFAAIIQLGYRFYAH